MSVNPKLNRSARTLYILLCALLFFPACGSTTASLTTTSSFKVRMFGAENSPVGADGTKAPFSQTYLFTGVVLTPQDGSADVNLYDGEAFTVRIVDRPQLIYNYEKLKDQLDKTFSKVTVKFDTAVVVATQASDANVLSIDTGNLSLIEAFTVKKDDSFTLNIRVNWARTVKVAEDGSETIQAPSFELSYKSIDE